MNYKRMDVTLTFSFLGAAFLVAVFFLVAAFFLGAVFFLGA